MVLCCVASARADDLVIADFESDAYPAGWVVNGTAFGAGPTRGTLANQQPVSGFARRRLVNSYLGGDDATGSLSSPAFTIERDFVNFLVGGGDHPRQACVNLLVDDKVVRTATGADDETLAAASWDVREFRGKRARIEILDQVKGRWGHINVDQIVQSDTPTNPDDITPPAVYRERLRPQFHFSPARGWMNDPNGLVFFDGEYHLFFQHNRESLVQVPVMSWGHAVSHDLVHWKELPIALKPDEKDGWIWSGSAVVDWKNTSGFGDGKRPPLVAMYTAAKDPFAQAIAYSNDRGRTWTKFAGNPVIAHIAGGNRDPHVIWHEASKRWVMALFKDVGETFCLFSSPDLKQWALLQELQMPGCTECPDFFPLPVDGDVTKTKWVFTAANGKYLVGDFDGQNFTPEGGVKQVDFGENFYAVQTYSDIPPSDGRRIQIAWMRGGRYPRMPFNQQMSFPAKLTLHSTDDGLRLFRYPVREIEKLRDKEHRWNDVEIANGEKSLDDVGSDLLDIEADVELPADAVFEIDIHGQIVSFDAKAGKLGALGTAPLALSNHRLRLRILIDRTSIETFANGGEVSLTSCFLPTVGDKGVKLRQKLGRAMVRSLAVYELRSEWH